VLHGTATYLVQDADGQVEEAHSIAPGLDYPAVGPEHSFLKDSGRAEYVWVSDAESLVAFQRLARLEGIIPALESSHAVRYAMTLAPTLGRDKTIVVCLSGRGDKDLASVMPLLGLGDL
jgi:tryptophan synthase beta chain